MQPDATKMKYNAQWRRQGRGCTVGGTTRGPNTAAQFPTFTTSSMFTLYAALLVARKRCRKSTAISEEIPLLVGFPAQGSFFADLFHRIAA